MSMTLPADRERSPLTSFLMSILRRGTEKYRSLRELDIALDELYDTSLSMENFKVGDMHVFGFKASMLSEEYLFDSTDIISGVLEIMMQMLYHPLLDSDGYFNEKNFESEKINICDEIRSIKNSTGAYASMRCREIMCADEPFGVTLIGDVDTVMQITREQLTRHLEFVLKNAHTSFSYVGAADPDTVASKIRAALEKENTRFGAPNFKNTVIRHAPVQKRESETMPVSQSKLLIGMRTGTHLGDDDYFSTLVFNEIFGSMQNSKLFLNVRERLGLCYSCYSSFNSYKGIIIASAGISAKNRDAAEGEIMNQLKKMQNGEISEAELEAAKKSILSGYTSIYDRKSSIHKFHYGRSIAGINNKDIESSIRRVSKISIADVIAASRRVEPDTVFFLEGTDTSSREGDESDE
jgi:predicted Zn-dependent peptidase